MLSILEFWYVLVLYHTFWFPGSPGSILCKMQITFLRDSRNHTDIICFLTLIQDDRPYNSWLKTLILSLQ